MGMGIGECEFCGRDSDAAARGHIICTGCREVIENELWKLRPDEPAHLAYDRAKEICQLRGRIITLREENDKLLAQNDHLEKEIKRLKSKTIL